MNIKPQKEAEIEISEISDVLETNYMPYAMSCIVARAIPEIDGLKPSHRKLLYTMYKMGLMGGQNTKSANVVGATMRLNPHGDMAIYETLVRLTTGKESLLHPFITSKGIFGKQYSDMAFAASRYTEVRLNKICEYIFGGIEKDAVDFIDNYDHTQTEPVLLPTAFPNILVSPNSGIAVGLASNICSFNLAEVCDLTSLYLKNGRLTDDEMLEILISPDFSTGAKLLYDRQKMLEIYKTGKGTLKLRAKYRIDKQASRVEVTEIPYTTTVEKIKDAIVKLAKDGKVRDITDVRDEIDINGLRLAIDLKKSASPEKIMARLMKSTPLEDTFSCNFNVLVGGSPKTLGIPEIIEEWSAFRVESLRRVFTHDWGSKKEKLHLLLGLEKILLDIDKAIAVIRRAENDGRVVPDLMAAFSIDEAQAEFIANIKLRNLNKDYIIEKTKEIKALEKDIAELYSLIMSESKIRKYIIKQLDEIKAKHASPRKTAVLYEYDSGETDAEDEPEDYPVTVFLSKEGYFKKCTAASLRGSDTQKFKENDELFFSQETTNRAEALFFTSSAQIYKSKLYDFDDTKASALGDFIPAKLAFEPGERVIAAFCTNDFGGEFILFFENGRAVKLPVLVYETKTNRKKLKAAFWDGSPLINAFFVSPGDEFLLISDAGRALLLREKAVSLKQTRTSQGVAAMSLKAGQKVLTAVKYDKQNSPLQKESRYRKSSLPSAGSNFEG